MTEKPKLLVVDDDEDLRTQMRWALADEFDVTLAGDKAEALERARTDRPAVVTLDLGLPPHPGGVEEGFATLDELQALDPSAKVIVITGREDRAHALRVGGAGRLRLLRQAHRRGRAQGRPAPRPAPARDRRRRTASCASTRGWGASRA